jgi:NAD(P)H-hydrate epimerase
MKELEDNCGISKVQLMENAGKAVYDVIKEKFSLMGKKILIIAYHGNNGGDGFVAARYLCSDCETDVLFVGDEAKFKEETLVNFRKIDKNDLIQILVELDQVNFNDYDIIIDALFGTGFKGEVKEPIKSIIDLINESFASKVSLDIPSGMIVKADLVITFHDIKIGMERFKDKVKIVDIGIGDTDGIK